MTKKVKSTGGDVEISLGERRDSQKNIMALVASSFGIYEATVWLNTPLEELEDKTPAEAMKEGYLKEVLSVAKKL